MAKTFTQNLVRGYVMSMFRNQYINSLEIDKEIYNINIIMGKIQDKNNT